MLNQDLHKHTHTESHLCALIVNFLSHWGRLVFAKRKRKKVSNNNNNNNFV